MHQEDVNEKGLSDHSNSVAVFDVGGCAEQWFVAADNSRHQQLAIAKLADGQHKRFAIIGYKPQQPDPEHFAVELFAVELLPIQLFAVR